MSIKNENRTDPSQKEGLLDIGERSESPLEHLINAIQCGRDWPIPMLESMAMWETPSETFRGRKYIYFFAGEAFDWMVLAERLLLEIKEFVPSDEIEEFLFSGILPDPVDQDCIKDLFGVEKYRGYLNYYYGVLVERAIQLASELEVQKWKISNGENHESDYTDEAFRRVYQATEEDLFFKFRQEMNLKKRPFIDLNESKEFTYWLFKYRIKVSDQSKIASDTRKGLVQLESMKKIAQIEVVKS